MDAIAKPSAQRKTRYPLFDNQGVLPFHVKINNPEKNIRRGNL